AAADEDVEALALIGGEQLGIVQPRDPDADGEHDGAADDRPRERAHADLVDAGHHLVPHRQGHALVAPEHRSQRPRPSTESRLQSSQAGLKPPFTGAAGYASASAPLSSGSTFSSGAAAAG